MAPVEIADEAFQVAPVHGREGEGRARVRRFEVGDDLNLIEPWWKLLRSLALKGKRFATWDEVCRAVEHATGYGNAHRHPFVWGRRRRHRLRRRAGIGRMPLVTRT